MSRLIRTYLDFTMRRAGSIVAFTLIASAVLAYWLVAYRPLGLDTNFTTLLPQEMPCVVASKRISKLMGSTDHLIIAIDSPSPEDNIAFTDDMAKALREFDELDYVTDRQDTTFFRQRLLQYLEIDDLKTIQKRADDRLKYEKKIRNPFYISLDDEEPPPLDISDVISRYEGKLKQRGVGSIGKVASTLGNQEHEKKPQGPDLGDRLHADEGKLLTILARPKKPALDMAFGRALVKKTEAVIQKLNSKRNPAMREPVCEIDQKHLGPWPCQAGRESWQKRAIAVGERKPKK